MLDYSIIKRTILRLHPRYYRLTEITKGVLIAMFVPQKEVKGMYEYMEKTKGEQIEAL